MSKKKERYTVTAEFMRDTARKALLMTDAEYKAYETEFINTYGQPDPKTVELFKKIFKKCLSPK